MYARSWSSCGALEQLINKSTFEDQLAKTGKLIYTNKGDSMMPLIQQDRDLLIIEPIHGRLKKYDVPLYKRDSGQYVLHRIFSMEGDKLVLMGDGNIQGHEHCALNEVAAKAVAVVTARGRHHDLYAPWRQHAMRLWWRLLPVRRWLLAIYRRTWLVLEVRGER